MSLFGEAVCPISREADCPSVVLMGLFPDTFSSLCPALSPWPLFAALVDKLQNQIHMTCTLFVCKSSFVWNRPVSRCTAHTTIQ